MITEWTTIGREHLTHYKGHHVAIRPSALMGFVITINGHLKFDSEYSLEEAKIDAAQYVDDMN